MKTVTLRIQLAAFLTLALTLLWIFALYEVQRTELAALEAANTQTRGVAQAFAENTLSAIKRIDIVLDNLGHHWLDGKPVFETEIDRLKTELDDMSIQLAVIDRNGWLVFSNLGLPEQPMNFADREHFRIHQAAKKPRLFISRPVLGRISQQWSIQFTRPLIRRGVFDGVIVLSVSPEYFSHFYQTLSIGDHGVTTMVRETGEVMSRAPYWDYYIGRSVKEAAPYLTPDTPTAGNFRLASPLDGIVRIYGYYKLPEQQIALVTGIALGEVMAPVRRQTALTFGIALVLSLIFILLGWIFLRRLAVQEQADEEIHRLNMALEKRVAERTADLARTNAELTMAASVFHSTTEGVLVADATPRILSVNPAFTDITGYESGEALGHKPSLLKSDRHDQAFYKEMWDTLQTKGRWQGEIWNRKKSGEAYLQWQTINRIDDENGQPIRYVSVFHDITELRQNQERIHHLAFHDALTGLPNRALLQDRLSQAIERAKREHGRVAVIFIDLDRFKSVNDGLGHDIGDLLLQEVARRIKARIRNMDTVARMGGDEFVVLMEDIKDARDSAHLADTLLARIAEPMEIAGHAIQIGASMGVAFFPEDCNDAVELMKHADTAMYVAKAAGRNTYRFFQPQMLEQTSQRLKIEIDLRQAVARREFELRYQPKINLQNGRIEGAEALIRWRHPQRGLVSPAEFIGVAEESGLIVEIGNWVIDEVFRQQQAWRAWGLSPISVAVNVSARQWAETDLSARIAQCASERNVPADAIEIELTESVVMAHPDEAAASFRKLREQGIRIAVDDFGTGYSSLAYLRRLPIDILKIDRSFVTDADRNPEDAEIVKTILALSKALKLVAVAEGVETQAQADMLRALGCEFAQGYYFARPLTAADLAEKLSVVE